MLGYSSMKYGKIMQNNQFLRRLLAVPVFYRVLIANSLIIFVGATGGTWLATRLDTNYGTAVLIIFIVVGWSVSLALNFLLLQIAFRPLMDLGKVMNRVQAGERSQRAPLTGFDPQADQLARTFNMMLEAIDEANRLRVTQSINAMEEERKRIARELHDETSQVLTSLLISLAVLEESITTQQARDSLAETRMLAHRTLRAIRNLSTNLRPSALDDLGLLPALRWYIKEYQQKLSLVVDFQAVGFKERLPAEMETALYRIVQESLTNIARHAHARKVNVELREDAHAVYVTITDDGRGIEPDQLQKGSGTNQERGWGLVGMHERAQLLDGSLEIKSSPGRGTTVEACIPLHSTAFPSKSKENTDQ
ncbi:MAG: sensor histidine kinase [Chloroflexi bacterium]|nr:MAG: sensor histidine kinase [Chloroflexota bacterium]